MSSSLNEPDLNTKLTTDVESYKVIANSLIMTGAFSISLLLSACAGQGANSQTNDNKMVTGQVSSDKAATTRYKSVTVTYMAILTNQRRKLSLFIQQQNVAS